MRAVDRLSPGAAVECRTEDAVAVIVLNRPETGNVLDLEATRAFRDAALAAVGARVVVIRSTGRLFCGGGDLKGLAGDADEVAAKMHEGVELLHEGLLALHEQNAPLITQVQGAAAGAGLSLVAASDIAVASPDASFVFGYTAAGLSPDGGASYFLPRAIGARRALELAISNRVLGAEEAARIGLISHLVAAEELAEFTERLASRLADGPTAAFGAVRRLIEADGGAALRSHLGAEAESISRLGASADGQEGIAAFLEKRRPRFAKAGMPADDGERN